MLKWQLIGRFIIVVCSMLLSMLTYGEEEEAPIKLESTFIGDKEQPAVSYFIPWKGTASPDKLRWDIEREHDNTLELIDRDIMLRSMNIYDEMQLEKVKPPE